MSRVLIAVGCDSYQYMNPLTCAESDATKISSLLLSPAIGDYDPSNSSLLLSPNKSQLEDCLNSLFFGSPIDTLTLFFAGHGGVKAGSYFICPVDAKKDALSATAIPLASLFIIINELSPKQSNIIIDACQGGGLGGELGALIKSPLFGENNAAGAMLLATCSKDEAAYEHDGQGVGTKAIRLY